MRLRLDLFKTQRASPSTLSRMRAGPDQSSSCPPPQAAQLACCWRAPEACAITQQVNSHCQCRRRSGSTTQSARPGERRVSGLTEPHLRLPALTAVPERAGVPRLQRHQHLDRGGCGQCGQQGAAAAACCRSRMPGEPWPSPGLCSCSGPCSRGTLADPPPRQGAEA